jgi:hypothetical protein
MAVFALLVDAKDDQAEAFYRHPGFVPFGSATRQLVLPVATFAADVRRSVASARACRNPFIMRYETRHRSVSRVRWMFVEKRAAM